MDTPRVRSPTISGCIAALSRCGSISGTGTAKKACWKGTAAGGRRTSAGKIARGCATFWIAVAYGLETGIWTSPLVRHVIEEEFGRQYHAGHVRKLLRQLGYSVQRPTTRLVQADVEQ